ncbi:MAG TPA: hypothetical protein VI299_27040 [Polyangiales bacterium]
MRGWKLGVLAAGLAVVACGDDDAAGSAIDAKSVSELGASEVKQLCNWLLELNKKGASDQQYCTFYAAQDATSVEECQAYRDECIAEFKTQGDPSCDDFDVSSECTAEVAAVKACVQDIYKVEDAAARKASCQTFEDVDQGGDVPASCSSLPEACFVFDAVQGTRGALSHR